MRCPLLPLSRTSRRMPFRGAPKNVSVAHGRCATEFSPQKYYFCGARNHAPQKVDNSVAHLQKCATEIFSMRHRNNFDYLLYLTIMYLWRTLFVRHRRWCATKLFTVRHKIICCIYYRLFAVFDNNTGILQYLYRK